MDKNIQGECNTILSACTKYRHLGQYCTHPMIGLLCLPCNFTLSILKISYSGNPKSCAELRCYHGATCSEIPRPQCVCDINCPDLDSPTENYVCGENGITYFSECRMQKDGCLKQKDIRMAYRGPCEGTYVSVYIM